MSFSRGTQDVEVELARVQSWIENNDPLLNGAGGNPGVIQLVLNREQREKEHIDAKTQSDRRLTLILGGISAIPVLIKLAEHFHWF